MRTGFQGAGTALMAALLVCSIPLLAQKSVPAFPRDGARNVLDNATVAIWDVTWPKGKSTGLLERRYDQVTVTLADGGDQGDARRQHLDGRTQPHRKRAVRIQGNRCCRRGRQRPGAARDGLRDQILYASIRLGRCREVPEREEGGRGSRSVRRGERRRQALREREDYRLAEDLEPARNAARALFLDRGRLDSAGGAGSGRCRHGRSAAMPAREGRAHS